MGGGSFHPSTLISATQLAVAVGEEVQNTEAPFFMQQITFSQVDKKLMAKLKDEEGLGDTRERIGFL